MPPLLFSNLTPEEFRTRRMRLGLTQADIAKFIGRGKSSVEQIENGRIRARRQDEFLLAYLERAGPLPDEILLQGGDAPPPTRRRGPRPRAAVPRRGHPETPAIGSDASATEAQVDPAPPAPEILPPPEDPTAVAARTLGVAQKGNIAGWMQNHGDQLGALLPKPLDEPEKPAAPEKSVRPKRPRKPKV